MAYPPEHKIDHPQNDSTLTSIGNIEFDSKISVGPSRVVAGCQDDPTKGFDLSNDAGNGRGGEDSILPNNQAANLGEEIQITHFRISESRAPAQKPQDHRQVNQELSHWTREGVLYGVFTAWGWLLLFWSGILLLLTNNTIIEIKSLLWNKAIPSNRFGGLCSFSVRLWQENIKNMQNRVFPDQVHNLDTLKEREETHIFIQFDHTFHPPWEKNISSA